MQTIERVRKRLIYEGLEVAIQGKKPSGCRRPKLEGKQEAHLIALTCSQAPPGRSRWTLRLLADRMVELEYVDQISHETIRQTLKKMHLSLG